MARDKGKKSRIGETCAENSHDVPDDISDVASQKKVSKKSKKQKKPENVIEEGKGEGEESDTEEPVVRKKKASKTKKKWSNDSEDESVLESKKLGSAGTEKDTSIDNHDSSENEHEFPQISGKKKKAKSHGDSSKKSSLKTSSFQLLDIEGDDVDEDEADQCQQKDEQTSNVDCDSMEQTNVKTESKGNKKSKKKERKKRGNESDEDLNKLLEELALEMTGQTPTSAPVETVTAVSTVETVTAVSTVETVDSMATPVEVKPTKKKKPKKKNEQDPPAEQLDENELPAKTTEDQFTVKSAAQKKKEKKEREQQKKSSQYEQKQSSKPVQSVADSAQKPKKEDIIEEKEIPESLEENKDDDSKKKKKKTKEDEKKEKKRPGKKQIAAMQEALKKVREEEERLKQEEEAKLKAEEEAEKLRQEKLRLEQERKEKKKQKEKEKRERLKAEGKLLSKSQKQSRARMEATLAALREQGVEIPQIGEKKERVPRLGDRKKVSKRNVIQEEETQETQMTNADLLESKDIISEVENVDINLEKKSLQNETDKVTADDVKDAWDETSDEEESESYRIENLEKSSGGSEETDTDDTESESEGSDSESDTGSEDERKKNDENVREKILERIQKRREENENNRNIAVLRSPVVCVLGHVDTGKTKILDKIRRTHVQDSEAGGITQQIGATMVPQDALKEQCKMVKNFSDMELKVPGLLIIDTPGHESFSNLRSRGSSLCDIAVLVVDIMHGIEPQTIESIDLLKKKKTPFIVALNKVDRLYEWKSTKSKDIADVIKSQARNTKMEFDDRAKEIILQFANQGLNAVLCYENSDPRSYISMVPTSAATGDGMGNLMALVVQLTQQMMAKRLAFSEELQATVLEVKAISGLGTTIDAILVNGRLREGDTIVLAGYEGPVVTQIRSLLMPQPLKELRVKNFYQEYKEVTGAQGVKITGKDLDKVIAGLQLLVAHGQEEIAILKEEVSASLSEAMNHIKLAERGVYVQASTLGSLEALLEFLKTSKIPYAGIRIGPVVKKDVMKASIMLEHDSQYAVILAFDVKVERDAQELADSLGVKIFQADIIYHLFDKFMAYREELKNKKRDEFKSVAIFPCKLRILPQFIFNSRDPIVVGVVVEAGVVKEGTPLCVPSKEFLEIGIVTTIEVNHKPIENARKGQEVCIKIEPAGGEAPKMYGRHFEYTDILITRQSIDVCKEYFRDDLLKTDWQLMVELKKTFQIM